MIKRLLFKVFLLFVLLCQLVNKAQAQYAVNGAASADLQKSIYWLTWTPGQFGMSTTSGATASSVLNGTYVWQYSPTAKITAVITNLATLDGGSAVAPYTPGSFRGDGLDVLYNGNNVLGKALTDNANTNDPANTYSRGIVASGIGTQNGQASHPRVKFDIALTVELLINNVWTAVSYPGMVIADAESIGWISDLSSSEYFSGTTNGPTGWQLLNLRLDGSTKNDGYLMDLSNSGKDFKIYISGSNKADPGAQAVMYAHGATSLSNLTMKGNGRTSIAIGFILPFDLGDAPNPLTGNSYVRPESYINDFTFTSKPINDANGIILKDVANSGGTGAGLSSIVPKAKLYMGALNVDADGLPTGSVFAAGATTDNTSNNNDEDAISGAALSAINIKVNRANDLTITVPSITNTENVAAYLDGWIDFNNDGKFDPAEKANTVTIGANSTATNTNLVFPKSRFGATASTIQFGSSTYMRLRLSKDVLTDHNAGTALDEAATSSSSNGEIEDYKLNDLTGVVISGNVFNDNNGSTGGIAGTALDALSGNQLYAYLVNNATGVVLQKVNVSGGAYTFTQVNNATYRVVISTSSIIVGANISTLGTLTAGWVASADSYGTFNSAGSGIESSTADLQVIVTPQISGDGGDVTNVNFGINQVPVANSNLGIAAKTNTDTTPVDLSSNDTDDGTVVSNTVEIENPTGPTYITTGSFTTAQGTYTINPTTRNVVFQSAGTFVGTTTPLNYRVKDNFGTYSNVSTFSFTVSIGGQNDIVSTFVNEDITTNVKTNDGAYANTVSPDPIAIIKNVTSPTNGTATIVDANLGTVKYSPNPNFVGTDSYTYQLEKNSVTSSPITVNITVKPKGSDDTDETTQGIAKETTVLTNDLTNTGVTITPGTNPANGTLSLTGGGTTITYTPTGTFVGSETYTYTLTKNGQTSAPITVTMAVKPKGSDDSDETTQGVAKATTVLTNDLTNTGVTITPGSNPANGTLSLTGGGTTITYTPTGAFVGSETYTYTLTKNGQTSAPITVTMAVKPKGSDDIDETTQGIAKATTVLTNDATNTGVTITPGSNPANGTLSLTGGGTTITYTPTGAFVGSETYTYTLTKNGQTSAPITVTMAVKPKGSDDTDETTQGIAKATTVLTNDLTNTGVTITPGSNPANGTLSLTGGGTTITYTPTGAFVGSETYTYTLTKNGQTSAPITVTMAVKPKGSDDTDETTQGIAKATTVLTNDLTNTGVTITPGSNPANGTLSLTGGGTTITYTPSGNFIGVNTYTYTLTKGGQTSAPITVTITVKPKGVNDVASTDVNIPVTTLVTDNDGPSGVAPVTVLKATDPVNGAITVNGSSITYTPNTNYVGSDTYTYTLTKNGILSDPITVTVNVGMTGSPDTDVTPINTPVATIVITNDGASGIGSTVTAGNGSNGTTSVSGGTVTYTPNSNFIGVDTYTYTLTKNSVTSAPITVTITVKPKGVNDIASTTINTPVATTVTGNDGPSGISPVTVTAGTAPANGSILVSGSSITYTPNTGYVGNDSYTYTLTKNGILSDPITVSVTVSALPTGSPDTDVTPINTPVATNVTANDADGTGSTVTAGNGSNGTTSVSGGTVTYTPNSNFIGVDTYTYTLTKNSVTSAPITVTITVKPKGVNDIASTTINTPVATTVTGNDGPSGISPVTVTAGTAPANGSILVSGSSITYTPNTGYVGNDSYTYTLTKNGILSDPITVSVTVSALPTGSPDTDVTPINTPVATNVTANDADGTGSTVTAGNGSNGTTSVSGGTVTYTPNSNFIGVDTYTYTLTKNSVTSAPITVTITVKPKGVNDIASTTINTPVATTVTGNDGPSGISPVTVTAGTAPANGSILVSGSSITYTPNTGYVGNDSYTYTLTKNGILSDPITVSVTVTATVPVGVNDSDLTPVNTPVTTTVIANDGTDGIGATVVATAGSNGTTTVSGGNVTYTPANGYTGTDTYTYTLTKNSVTSAPITVTINVYSATMSLSKVANNGAAKAGDVINYTLIIKNTGTVVLTNIVITDGGADAGSISPASIATLAPGASATATANHTVVAADVLAGKFINQATATAKDPKNNTVSKVSDDPTTTIFDDPTIVPIIPLVPASINLAKTGVFAGNQVNYTFIITNNGGVALNTITLTDAKLGLNGVTITAPSGGLLPNASLTYNAVYTLTQADKDAGVVNNTASVSAKDPSNNTVTGTGSTVTTVTTSPVATNDAAETKSGIPVIISVLTNDNPKNSTFNLTSIEIVGNPMHGTVVANADGTITYTPTAGYVGTDSFTYRVKDAYGYYTNVATVSITTNEFKDLKIPTLFSPNGDGVNDGFVIKDLADYAQNELIVLNRWGNEVYRQANYQNNWSGTGLNEGTYFYIVRLKKANGDSWVIKKGYVTLIRTFKK